MKFKTINVNFSFENKLRIFYLSESKSFYKECQSPFTVLKSSINTRQLDNKKDLLKMLKICRIVILSKKKCQLKNLFSFNRFLSEYLNVVPQTKHPYNKPIHILQLHKKVEPERFCYLLETDTKVRCRGEFCCSLLHL